MIDQHSAIMRGSNAVDIMQRESRKNSPAGAADARTRARALALSGLGLAGSDLGGRARARSPPARCLRERWPEEERESVSAESPMQERTTVMRCGAVCDIYLNLLKATTSPVAGHRPTPIRRMIGAKITAATTDWSLGFL